jgi:hypothetical protein
VIAELDTVVLTRDLPQENLKAGDIGAVVMVYGNGEAYEVEFVTLKGQTVSVVTVPHHGIRSVEDNDLPTARHAAVA